ncbi:hypothetical protein F5Y17DRAFT_457079 [Xylariaceae sp. FL0594]|nr:hypothetical protein F5Y17DRAFT_457079 [Xylariaceae sp. FL0594]
MDGNRDSTTAGLEQQQQQQHQHGQGQAQTILTSPPTATTTESSSAPAPSEAVKDQVDGVVSEATATGPKRADQNSGGRVQVAETGDLHELAARRQSLR